MPYSTVEYMMGIHVHVHDFSLGWTCVALQVVCSLLEHRLVIECRCESLMCDFYCG